jgi:hypothetical protein
MSSKTNYKLQTTTIIPSKFQPKIDVGTSPIANLPILAGGPFSQQGGGVPQPPRHSQSPRDKQPNRQIPEGPVDNADQSTIKISKKSSHAKTPSPFQPPPNETPDDDRVDNLGGFLGILRLSLKDRGNHFTVQKFIYFCLAFFIILITGMSFTYYNTRSDTIDEVTKKEYELSGILGNVITADYVIFAIAVLCLLWLFLSFFLHKEDKKTRWNTDYMKDSGSLFVLLMLCVGISVLSVFGILIQRQIRKDIDIEKESLNYIIGGEPVKHNDEVNKLSKLNKDANEADDKKYINTFYGFAIIFGLISVWLLYRFATNDSKGDDKKGGKSSNSGVRTSSAIEARKQESLAKVAREKAILSRLEAEREESFRKTQEARQASEEIFKETGQWIAPEEVTQTIAKSESQGQLQGRYAGGMPRPNP